MPTTDSNPAVPRSSVHLDAIRGLAALTVMVGHTRGLFFAAEDAPAEEKTANGISHGAAQGTIAAPPVTKIAIGNEAVMIFFVLSGYLVGGSVLRSIRKKAWSWKLYLTKRMTRLWVVLLPAVLFGVAVDHLGMHAFPGPASLYAPPPQQPVLPLNYREHLAAKVVAGNVLFLQTVRVPMAGTNVALWSLANEFWYYLAFPLLVLICFSTARLPQRILYALALAGVVWFVGMGVMFLFPIWLLGALVSELPLRLPKQYVNVASVALTVILLVTMWLVRQLHLGLIAAQWPVALAFACLLYAVLHQTSRSTSGLYSGIAGFISRISYTLYLVHVPLLVFVCAMVDRPWRPWPKTPNHFAYAALIDALVVLAAYVFYRIFEANTDKVRMLLLHRRFTEQHVPAQ